MSLDAFNDQSTEPMVVKTPIRITGTGAATPTKVYGRGVVVGRTGVGIITFTWLEAPGSYIGVTGYCYEATVQNGVRGYTMVPGDWNPTTRVMTINITSTGDTLIDLAAAQYLTFEVSFKRAAAGL